MAHEREPPSQQNPAGTRHSPNPIIMFRHAIPGRRKNSWHALQALDINRPEILRDIGTQLNVNDVEHDVEQIKESLWNRQAEHNSLESGFVALQKENHELKLYMATLIHLLVNKNLITQDELKRFVDLLDPAEAS